FRGRMGITNRMTSNVVIENNVDGTRPEEEGAVVIDDSHGAPGFEMRGVWHAGVTGRDYLDSTRWAPLLDEVAVASWSPDLPRKGRYEVFLWWGANNHDDRAGNALVKVHHRDGTEELRVDQTKNIGE